MNHVVLLGDSIFDNAAYVRGRPDVVRQLRPHLPPGWRATLCAVDGAVSQNVAGQLRGAPSDASHLVVSSGGNDALRHMGVLEDRAPSIADALNRLADIAGSFALTYRAMVDGLAGTGLPAALCTVYDPRFPEPRMQRLAVTALTLFNDVIVREAGRRGMPLIDLRLVCDRDEDFANPIEPSAEGGEKIARAIACLLLEHDFGRHRSTIYVN